MKILVLNGPNLNMLGIREPALYGSRSYADLVRFIEGAARDAGIEVEVFQTTEVDLLHQSKEFLVSYIQFFYCHFLSPCY